MSTRELTPGYEATVHQSVLRPVLRLGAPDKPAMLNFFVGFGMTINMRVWWWPGVGLVVHVALMLVARYDHFLPQIFQQSFQRRPYYGV